MVKQPSEIAMHAQRRRENAPPAAMERLQIGDAFARYAIRTGFGIAGRMNEPVPSAEC